MSAFCLVWIVLLKLFEDLSSVLNWKFACQIFFPTLFSFVVFNSLGNCHMIILASAINVLPVWLPYKLLFLLTLFYFVSAKKN